MIKIDSKFLEFLDPRREKFLMDSDKFSVLFGGLL